MLLGIVQASNMTQFRQLEHPYNHVLPLVPAHNQLGFTFREHNAGEAWYQLKQQAAALRRGAVVITANPCPEYALDLLELGVCAVLQIGISDQAEVTALEFAKRGAFYSVPHHFPSCLRTSEREIFRFVVCGMSNQQIARKLNKSISTVRNKLNRILTMLGLQNRTQLAMYYLGHWQFLGRSMTNFMQTESSTARMD